MTEPAAVDPDLGTPTATERTMCTEILIAVLLGIAAVLTAWAAYRSAVDDRHALQTYTASSVSSNESNRASAVTNVQLVLDEVEFLHYLAARSSGKDELAETIKTHVMRENLSAAVDWWQREGEDVSLVEGAGTPYVYAFKDKAAAKRAEAERLFAEAVVHDERGNRYELAAVLLAVALFFGGIAGVAHRALVSRTMIVASTVALILGTVRLVAA